MDKMESGKMSQKEYLRKYLSGKDDGAAKKKKKKKLKVGPKTVKVIDDDIDISSMRPLEDGEFRILNTTEDAPQIVGVIDERGPVDFADKRRWRIIADDGEGNVACDSQENYGLLRSNIENGKHDKRKDANPSRMASSDRDFSPPRANERSKSDAKRSKKNKRRDASSSDSSDTNDERKSKPKKAVSGRRRDSSPARKSSESDQSPPRKRKNDRDIERAENRGKGKNRGHSDSDQSPQRRRREDRNIDGNDSDRNPPRRKKNNRNFDDQENYGKRKNRGNSDSDQSPPRRRKNDRNVDNNDNREKRKNRENSDSDESPPRRRKNERPIDKEKSGGKRKNRENSDSDQSPPRRRKNDRNIDDEENYGKGKHRENVDSDQSPPRRRKNDRTVDNEKSSARRKNRGNSDSDQSPPRRRKNERPIDNERNGGKRKSRKNSDSDLSPPRRSKNDGSAENRTRNSRGSDSDLSPPRAPKNIRTDSKSYRDEGKNGSRNDGQRRRRDDRSPRRSRWNEDDSRNSRDLEPRGKRSEAEVEPKMKKTLDGKVAGLQDARALKIENEAHRKREAAMFKKLSAEVSGVGQAAVFRDRKTGRRRDFAAEAAETREKEKRQAEIDDKYAKWGKGLKQVDDQAEKRERDMYEMSKPLARYANDADLDKALREVEREGDTMLAEIKQRRIKEGKSEPARPAYQGSCAPNRFGIRPGHRWDGVDRSNGYEKKWFEARNARTALQEEAYKWSTADM